MSKGSLFWSKARGKLGDVVLSQLKGVQIARAYQPQVANPRSTAQTDQRILFSNAVKFYKHATQNLFKFAYEDKRSNESYYNAFMRKNAKVSMLPTRAQYLNPNYPAIGNQYLMSQGSLPPLPYKYDESGGEFQLVLGNVTSAAEDMTVGEVSTALISSNYVQSGDIVTIVAIFASISSIDDEGASAPSWNIVQFIADTTNTTDFTLYLSEQAHDLNVLAKKNSTGVGTISVDDAGAPAGFAMIVSRVVTGQQLLVSDAYLINSKLANDIYQKSLQADYRTVALNSWGRKTEAILQGSIAKNV